MVRFKVSFVLSLTLSPSGHLFRAFQAALNDSCRDNYRRSALSNGRRVGVRAFLYNIVRHLGTAIIAISTNPRSMSRYHVIDMIPSNIGSVPNRVRDSIYTCIRLLFADFLILKMLHTLHALTV